MIEIKPGHYYHAMFYKELPDDIGNIMGILYRKGKKIGDGKWMLQYRFRYYKGERIFFSEDEFKWYRARIEAPVKKVLEDFENFTSMLNKQIGGGDVEIFELKGDDKVALKKMTEEAPRWMHSQVMKDIPDESNPK